MYVASALPAGDCILHQWSVKDNQPGIYSGSEVDLGSYCIIVYAWSFPGLLCLAYLEIGLGNCARGNPAMI